MRCFLFTHGIASTYLASGRAGRSAIPTPPHIKYVGSGVAPGCAETPCISDLQTGRTRQLSMALGFSRQGSDTVMRTALITVRL